MPLTEANTSPAYANINPIDDFPYIVLKKYFRDKYNYYICNSDHRSCWLGFGFLLLLKYIQVYIIN